MIHIWWYISPPPVDIVYDFRWLNTPPRATMGPGRPTSGLVWPFWIHNGPAPSSLILSIEIAASSCQTWSIHAVSWAEKNWVVVLWVSIHITPSFLRLSVTQWHCTVRLSITRGVVFHPSEKDKREMLENRNVAVWNIKINIWKRQNKYLKKM